jgi:hypothetical protein
LESWRGNAKKNQRKIKNMTGSNPLRRRYETINLINSNATIQKLFTEIGLKIPIE